MLDNPILSDKHPESGWGVRDFLILGMMQGFAVGVTLGQDFDFFI